MLSIPLGFLIIFCSKNVFANKVLCEPTDNTCLTKAVRDHVYQRFIVGLPGVASSDPLHLDEIVADLPHFKYTLKNATLFGMKDCDFLKLKLSQDVGSVKYELLCPHLVIQSEYEVKGEIEAVAVEGKSNCNITYDNYHIIISGKYERVTGEDGKQHFRIIEFSLEIDLQAGTSHEYQNLVISDKDRADEISNNLEEITRDIVMNFFLETCVHNLQDFQRAVPLEDLHFIYV